MHSAGSGASSTTRIDERQALATGKGRGPTTGSQFHPGENDASREYSSCSGRRPRRRPNGQDLIVQCPNTGDDIEVRFDEFGAAAIRNDDGEIVAVLQVQVVRID